MSRYGGNLIGGANYPDTARTAFALQAASHMPIGMSDPFTVGGDQSGGAKRRRKSRSRKSRSKSRKSRKSRTRSKSRKPRSKSRKSRTRSKSRKPRKTRSKSRKTKRPSAKKIRSMKGKTLRRHAKNHGVRVTTKSKKGGYKPKTDAQIRKALLKK